MIKEAATKVCYKVSKLNTSSLGSQCQYLVTTPVCANRGIPPLQLHDFFDEHIILLRHEVVQ